MKIKWLAKKIGVTLWDHRADIEFFVGTGLVVTGSVMTVAKAEEIVDVKNDIESQKKTIELKDEHNDWDTSGQRTMACVGVAKNAVVGYTKVLALPVGLQVAGITLQTVSHQTQKGQIATLATNLAAETMAFAAYRQNVISDAGEEKDQEYLTGLTSEEMKMLITDNDGDFKTKDLPMAPPHSFLFDETNDNYEKAPGANRDFLEGHLRWLNDRLWTEGILWENDIRRDVGAPIDPDATNWGITAVDDEGNRQFISFGIEKNTERAQAFRDGKEQSFWVMLNMEPNISQKMYRLNKYHS